MKYINKDIVIGSCEYVGSNKLGCQIIKANQVAYYKIKKLDNILHGETNYPRGRDIFVNILRNRAAGKYNKEEERYYGELVFEVLGMNFNRSIEPERMLKALQIADEKGYKVVLEGSGPPGALDAAYGLVILLMCDGKVMEKL